MRPTRFTPDMIAAYVEKGYWDSTDLISIFKNVVHRNTKGEAVADSSGKVMSWAELDAFSDRLALGFLKFGLKKDDVVVSQLPNSVKNVAVRLAILKAGIIGIFPPMTLRREVGEILSKFRPSAFVGVMNEKYNSLQQVLNIQERERSLKGVFHIEQSNLENTIPIDEIVNTISSNYRSSEEDLQLLEENKCGPYEVAFLGLTSGSTGSPKACEWPTPSVKLYAQTVIERMRLTREDVMGIIAPLSGGPGITLWLTAILLGAKTALLERFDPESALQFIEKQRITAIGLVPAQLIKMSNHPNFSDYDLSSLRVCRPTASLIAREVALGIEQKMGCRIVPAAGSQESMTIGHTDIRDPGEIRLETIGKPWKYNEVKIVDEKGRELPPGKDGEIRVRGPCTGSGYFRDIDSTKKAWGALGEEGWYRTGDMGKMDQKGDIAITGRKKNMILRGGQNIYPEEIEKILLLHPKLLEAVIVPMPDPEMGEKACAFVSVKKREDVFSLKELVDFLEEKQIAKFKFPEKMIRVDEFPTVGDGAKIDRRALSLRLKPQDR